MIHFIDQTAAGPDVGGARLSGVRRRLICPRTPRWRMGGCV